MDSKLIQYKIDFVKYIDDGGIDLMGMIYKQENIFYPFFVDSKDVKKISGEEWKFI